jgi:hypothetical protein
VLEAKSQVTPDETVRGSVKAVALGVDSYLIMSDLLCSQRSLPIAWNAVVSSNDGKQISGFQTLQTRAFIDAFLSGGKVVEVVPLVTKQVAGTITSLVGGRLELNVQTTANRPGWFENYGGARVVDENGHSLGNLLPGDNVQVTYLDPVPGEVGDQIPLQIVITGA